jgi:hypothetical protein
LAWDQRPIFGNARGLPWWAAVLLAFGVAAIAAWIDIHRQDSLGRIYQGAYILGCILAVAAVRRRNLFGPIVQPPLVFAVTAIGAIVLAQPGSPFSAGFKQLVFTVALPLTSNFLTMAFTTALTVAIGLFRLFRQRNPEPRTRSSRGTRAPLDEGAAGNPEPGRRRPDRTGGRVRSDLDPPPPSPRVGGRDRRERQARAERGEQPPPRGGRGRAEPSPPARGGRERSMPPENRRRQPGMRGEPGQRRPDEDQPRRPRRRRDV